MSNQRPVISGKQASVASADGTLNLIYMEDKSYLQFTNLELIDLKATECSGVRIVGGGSNVGMYLCLFGLYAIIWGLGIYRVRYQTERLELGTSLLRWTLSLKFSLELGKHML
jgi:hypothetical protein